MRLNSCKIHASTTLEAHCRGKMALHGVSDHKGTVDLEKNERTGHAGGKRLNKYKHYNVICVHLSYVLLIWLLFHLVDIETCPCGHYAPLNEPCDF